MKTEDTIKKILVGKFGVREDEISPDANFSEDLFFREEDIDDLIDYLEDNLQLQIDREGIITVRDLQERIEENG